MSVIVMLDNSSSSINGDFIPSRLEAQKIAVERFADFQLSIRGQSEIAVGSMSNTEFGLRLSFTQSVQKLRDVTEQISATGNLSLYRGIKTALLALKHNNSSIQDKSMIVFICSDHDITHENSSEIGHLVSAQKVSLKMVVFGEHVKNEEMLHNIARVDPRRIRILRIKKSRTMLSDDVLQDAIEEDPMNRLANISLPECARNDPGLATALALSRQKTPQTENKPSSISMLLAHDQDDPPVKRKKPCVKRCRNHDKQ